MTDPQRTGSPPVYHPHTVWRGVVWLPSLFQILYIWPVSNMPCNWCFATRQGNLAISRPSASDFHRHLVVRGRAFNLCDQYIARHLAIPLASAICNFVFRLEFKFRFDHICLNLHIWDLVFQVLQLQAPVETPRSCWAICTVSRDIGTPGTIINQALKWWSAA